MDEHPGRTTHDAAHVSASQAPHPAADHAGHGDAHAAPHAGAHAALHGQDDMGLGPIDWMMWGTGVLGVAIGVIGALCFAASTGRLG